MLDVVDIIYGKCGTRPPSSYKQRRCSCCAAVRRLPRDKLVVLNNTPHLLPKVPVGEAHPEHDGPAHGTRVPRIRVRSVE